MSDLFVFIVGAIIFAITVYGTVIAGGIKLSRREIAENSHLQDRIDSKELDKTIPAKVKY